MPKPRTPLPRALSPGDRAASRPFLADAVDELIDSATALPCPEERRRLRLAHGLTQQQVAEALRVRRPTVSDWETGRSEPRRPEREAYQRLLRKLSDLHPQGTSGPLAPPAPSERVEYRPRTVTPRAYARMFTGLQRDAWRLEGRARYAWHLRSREYAAFTAGRHVDWDAQHPWGQNRREQTDLGKTFRRVRIIDHPHTECQLFLLLQNTANNTFFGEDIRFLPRATADELGVPREDFWVFDSATVAVLHYGEDDERHRIELWTDPDTVLRHVQIRDAAWHHALTRDQMADALGV